METEHKIIDSVLEEYKPHLKNHFNKYKNHVYRVFNLCLLLDKNEENKIKYAIATVFHDLGIWTNNTFDYLKPSIILAGKYLKINDKSDWTEEITLMIDMHHKRSRYKGNYVKTVETFRKADWIDVTLGFKSFGVDKSFIRALKYEFPNEGFHNFLTIQTFKYFTRHPLNPLPMFKK